MIDTPTRYMIETSDGNVFCCRVGPLDDKPDTFVASTLLSDGSKPLGFGASVELAGKDLERHLEFVIAAKRMPPHGP